MPDILPFDISVPLRAYLDAVPAIAFAVDGDVRAYDYNKAAAAVLGPSLELCLHKRGGDLLHCIHALSGTDACGRTEFCKDCVVRNAVVSATASEETYRAVARMTLRTDEGDRDVCLLISAVPLAFAREQLVLLVLEDATELFQLRRLLVVCSHCHRVRNDLHLWQDLTTYLREHEAAAFSHGLCPDCLRKLHPDMAEQVIERTKRGH